MDEAVVDPPRPRALAGGDSAERLRVAGGDVAAKT
jgi:hypothetical protein